MRNLGAALVPVSGLLLLAGCGTSSDATEAAPAPTATVTETATPEPDPTELDDPWLAAMREDHLDDLFAWWIEYSDAACEASESECYELFEAGVEPMMSYAEDYRSSVDRPDYVSTTAPNPYIAAETMEDWSSACPEGDMCDQLAKSAEERALDVLTEAARWGD